MPQMAEVCLWGHKVGFALATLSWALSSKVVKRATKIENFLFFVAVASDL
jgi:hypothetical protein